MSEEGTRGDPISDIEFAQALVGIAGAAWTLFAELTSQGFTEAQALDLVKAWMHGVAGGKS